MTLVLLLPLLSGVVTAADGGGFPYSARERIGISDHERTHQKIWVNITYPADGDVLNRLETTVVGTAFDDFRVDWVELSTDGENWVPAIVIVVWGDVHRGGAPEDKAGPQELPMNGAHWSGRLTLSVGLNTIFARATDQSGKTATDSVMVMVADVVPSAPWGLQATAGDGEVRLAWRPPLDEGSSPITHYSIYRGTTPGSLTFHAEVGDVFAYTDPALPDAVAFYYAVSAASAAGESLLSSEISARLPDVTAPTIAITAPGTGLELTSAYVTVSGRASDNVAIARVELSLDGIKWVMATGTNPWSGTVTLTEASNIIHARATDMEGNTATVTVAVTVAAPSPGPQVSASTVAFTAFSVLAAIGAISALLLWRMERGRSRGRRPPR